MPDALRRFKAEIFQALAHPTRIAIVEVLRDGELSAGAIIDRVGLEQANASQHFAVLRSKNIVTCRKEGNQVFYSVRDQWLNDMLESMRAYLLLHIEDSMSLLKEMTDQEAVTLK